MVSSSKKRKKSWQRNRSFPKKRNIARLFKKIMFIIFIFLIVYFIFFSQFFLIKKIEIEGNKNILSDNIRETTNNNISQPILGFIPRNNFFLSKNKEIEKLLLNEFFEIKAVEVNKKFPNSLKIKITEKNPLIIWCRLEDCYYIDNNGVAFLSADKNLLTEKDSKFIKIMEQLEIEEEIENKIETNGTGILEDESIFVNIIERDKEKEEEIIAAVFESIKINDEVSDSDFINFAVKIDKEIKNKTTLNINYYKTKGTGSRELIAYTDKNTRIYFNTTDDADLQVNYLKDFLSKGMDRKKIDALEYIYLKSGNKIFYK